MIDDVEKALILPSQGLHRI